MDKSLYTDDLLQELHALREKARQFDTLLHNVNGMAYRCSNDTQWSMEFVSGQVKALTGYDRDDIIDNKNIAYNDLIHPEDKKYVNDSIQSAIREGKPFTLTYRILSADGQEKWVWEQGCAVPSDKSSTGVLEGFISDITPIKQSEDNLRQQTELLQTIMDNIPIMVIFMEPDGFHRWVNKTWENTLGWSLEETRNVDILSKCYPDPGYRDKVLNFINESAGIWQDFKTMTKSGKVIDTRWIDVRLADNTLIGLGMDVTEQNRIMLHQKELEQQLIQAQKMESIGRLAGGIAHDFNNLLTVIKGNSELALMGLDQEDTMYQEVAEIVETSERATNIIRQLLTFSRKQRVLSRTLNLNDIIESQQTMLARLVGEDIQFIYHLADDLWDIMADPHQIDQIIMNFSVNARDAIKGTGTITIETQNVTLDETYKEKNINAAPGDYVLLIYSDSGGGMDAETQANIFEPFFTTKQEGMGTGLGLSTVYGIVKQNDGMINVYSEPGFHTSFKVYFPRKIGEHGHETLQEPTTPSMGTETILVAEDEQYILNFTSKVLEKYGYTVIKCHSAIEALEQAKKYRGEIHLLLTDVVMPVMNGKELQEEIEMLLPGIKTVFMSGYTANVIASHGITGNHFNFIQKPFSTVALADTIRKALDMP